MTGRLVWLASYPKSGNTWLRVLLQAYFSGSERVDLNALRITHHAASMSFAEHYWGVFSEFLTPHESLAGRRDAYRLLSLTSTGPVFMKIHDANIALPDGSWLCEDQVTQLAIHIVRHPFDVAVSKAFFSSRKPDFDAAVAELCDQARIHRGSRAIQLPQPLGSWSFHTESWLAAPIAKKCLIKYEDLLADTEAVLHQLLKALDAGNEPDAQRVAMAIEAASFSKLVEQESQFSFVEKPQFAERFFRSGTKGDWRNYLTPQHCEKLWRAHGTTMKKLGYVWEGENSEPDLL